MMRCWEMIDLLDVNVDVDHEVNVTTTRPW